MAKNEFVFKVIADLSQPERALEHYTAKAKSAASAALAVPASGKQPTLPQRRAALAEAKGRAKAETAFAYESGSFGPVGSAEARKVRDAVYARQNREFRKAREEAGVGLTPKQEAAQKAAVAKAQEEHLALLRRATTQTQLQAILDGDITKAKRLIAASEKRRAAAAEKTAQSAAKEAVAAPVKAASPSRPAKRKVPGAAAATEADLAPIAKITDSKFAAKQAGLVDEAVQIEAELAQAQRQAAQLRQRGKAGKLDEAGQAELKLAEAKEKNLAEQLEYNAKASLALHEEFLADELSKKAARQKAKAEAAAAKAAEKKAAAAKKSAATEETAAKPKPKKSKAVPDVDEIAALEAELLAVGLADIDAGAAAAAEAAVTKEETKATKETTKAKAKSTKSKKKLTKKQLEAAAAAEKAARDEAAFIAATGGAKPEKPLIVSSGKDVLPKNKPKPEVVAESARIAQINKERREREEKEFRDRRIRERQERQAQAEKYRAERKAREAAKPDPLAGTKIEGLTGAEAKERAKAIKAIREQEEAESRSTKAKKKKSKAAETEAATATGSASASGASAKAEKEADTATVKAKKKEAQEAKRQAEGASKLTAEQQKRIREGAQAGIGSRKPRQAEDPAAVARRQQAEQRAKIQAQDALLENPVRDLSQVSYKQGLEILAKQRAQIRAIGKKTAAEQAAAQLAELAAVEAEFADKESIQAKARLVAAQKKLAAAVSLSVEKILTADAEYLAVQREIVAVKQQALAAELRYQLANETFKQDAAINVQKAALSERRLNVEKELLLADTETLKLKAKNIVLEEQYQRALAAEVRVQAEAAGLQQKGLLARLFGGGSGNRGGGGGRYGISQGPGGSGGGLGAFFGQGAATTLKYAVPSAILFGAAAGITSSVKAATELEKTLNQIEAQFIATDKAAEFPGFKQSILEIARDSGLAAEAVAEIGFQLQGAFGDSESIGGRTGTNLVQDQLEASAEISRVTGLAQKEIVDSLTAASFAFDASFRDIGDVTLQLQDRFGVLAKEIIPFLGDIAPVAEAAGFSLEEFATIAALTQQKSGRSGTALAEAYGRVLPALSEAKEELYQLAQTNDSLNTPEFLQAVAQGDAAPIFLGLSEAFSSMSESSQDFVINLLGGRREASAILAAFEDGDALMQEINTTSRDNNVLAARYAKLQETLSQQVAKLAEEFRQFGIDLYEAGLGDALKTLVSSFSFLLDVLTGVVGLFGDFNSLLGGIPGKLLAILAVIKLIQVTMGSGFGQKIGGIPANVRAAVQNGPTLSGLATNVGGFGRTVQAQGVRGSLSSGGVIGGSPIAQVASVVGAAYAVSEVQKARDRARGDLDSARQQVVENLTSQSRAEVDQFISDRDSFMDQVREDGWVATTTPWLTGASNLRASGIDAIQQQDAPRVLAALRAFQNLETPGFQKDEALLEEVIANFSSDPTNDQFYEDAHQYLITAAAVSREAKNAINEKLGQSQAVSDAQQDADAEAAAAVLQLGTAQQDLESVIKDFEAGRGTSADVERAYQEAIDVYTKAISGVGIAPDPATVALLQDAILARDKFVSEQILGANELTQTLDAATGGGGPAAEIAGLQAALRNPKFTDAASRRQAALDIVALNQELLDTQVEAADSAGEAIRILQNGVAVDPEARIILILEQLRGNEIALDFAEGFNAAAKRTVGFLQESSDAIAALMVETGQSYNEAVLALIEQAIQDKLVLLSYSTLTADARAQILDALSSLYEQKDALKDLPQVDVNPVDRITGSASDIADQQAQAWDDAAAYAQEQQDRLEEWRQAAREIEDAQADLFKAGIENDPVALARFEQSEADRALRNATTEAERLSAQAQRIRADRSLQEAIQDVFASQADLLNAMFEYGGNTVQAARLGLKTAKDRLAYLQASGAGDAAINRAKGDVVSAQGALRDARLDRKLQDYAFLYDMDKINKQQYIAYLMQLKEIPDLTTQQLRDLDRQIKSLRDELGADFQFNLPTTLGLPTLYEVRRTNQTPGGGGSYQDMRNYNIVMYINNGMDEAAATQFLSEAMGTNRVSTGTRRY